MIHCFLNIVIHFRILWSGLAIKPAHGIGKNRCWHRLHIHIVAHLLFIPIWNVFYKYRYCVFILYRVPVYNINCFNQTKNRSFFYFILHTFKLFNITVTSNEVNSKSHLRLACFKNNLYLGKFSFPTACFSWWKEPALQIKDGLPLHLIQI